MKNCLIKIESAVAESVNKQQLSFQQRKQMKLNRQKSKQRNSLKNILRKTSLLQDVISESGIKFN